MSKRVGFSQLEGEILTNIEQLENSAIYFTTERGRVYKLSDCSDVMGKFKIDSISSTANIFGKPIIRADLFLNKKNSPTYKIRVQDDIVIITWKKMVDGYKKGKIIFEEVVNSSIGPILEGLKEGDIVSEYSFKSGLYKILYSEKPFMAREFFYRGGIKDIYFTSGFYAVGFTNFIIEDRSSNNCEWQTDQKYIIDKCWIADIIKEERYLNKFLCSHFMLLSTNMVKRRKGRKRKTQQCIGGFSPYTYVIPELGGGTHG